MTIGHNGGPPIKDETPRETAFRIRQELGKAPSTKIKPFGCGAPWTNHATNAELRQLAINELRIARKKAALKALTANRYTIMRRCIRRMRRAIGKE